MGVSKMTQNLNCLCSCLVFAIAVSLCWITTTSLALSSDKHSAVTAIQKDWFPAPFVSIEPRIECEAEEE